MKTMTISRETTTAQSVIGKRGCFFYIKRGLLAVVLLPLILIAGGFAYETVMQTGDAQRYPPPGQLVKVDGYTMHILCVGEGSPTVILESGAGAFSLQNIARQESLRKDTRVCVYDRAGMGWSEARPETRTAWEIARELHTLLASAHIDPPYVMVGPSNGGLYVRAYAADYPDEAAGLVLLDPTSEQSLAETKGLPLGLWTFMGRVGFFRLFSGSLCNGCTPENSAMVGAKDGYAVTWQTYDAEWKALQSPDEIAKLIERMGQAGALGDTPLIVIAANQSGLPLDEADPTYRAGIEAEKQATVILSTNTRYTIVMSDHGLSDQNALILQSIRDVIEAVRTGQPLTQ